MPTQAKKPKRATKKKTRREPRSLAALAKVGFLPLPPRGLSPEVKITCSEFPPGALTGIDERDIGRAFRLTCNVYLHSFDCTTSHPSSHTPSSVAFKFVGNAEPVLEEIVPLVTKQPKKTTPKRAKKGRRA